MRRLCALVLILSLLAVPLAGTVRADNVISGACENGVKWSLDLDTGTLTVSGKGEIERDSNQRYPWWSYRDKIRSVVIKSGITAIGHAAFGWCGDLTGVSLPTSLKTIEGQAFDSCVSLSSITIPSGVTSIESSAFSRCTGLAAISVNANNKTYASVDGVLFDKAKKTLIRYPEGKPGTSYSVPKGVTTIVSFAFDSCESLVSITLPDSLSTIKGHSFAGCTSLTAISVTADNTVFSSVDGVLFNKEQTTLVQYPKGKPGTSYSIPAGVITLEPSAFQECENLISVTIPEGVTTIGPQAFHGCPNLSEITIPSSVTTIGQFAFRWTDRLTAFHVHPDNPNYTDIDGVLFSKDRSTLIQYPASRPGASYTVPDGTVTLDYFSFSYCDNLNEVKVADTVETALYAFFGFCENLTALYLPAATTDIYIFGCPNITIYGIPGSAAEEYAIQDGFPFVSLLRTFQLPEGVAGRCFVALYGENNRFLRVTEAQADQEGRVVPDLPYRELLRITGARLFVLDPVTLAPKCPVLEAEGRD